MSKTIAKLKMDATAGQEIDFFYTLCKGTLLTFFIYFNSQPGFVGRLLQCCIFELPSCLTSSKSAPFPRTLSLQSLSNVICPLWTQTLESKAGLISLGRTQEEGWAGRCCTISRDASPTPLQLCQTSVIFKRNIRIRFIP